MFIQKLQIQVRDCNGRFKSKKTIYKFTRLTKWLMFIGMIALVVLILLLVSASQGTLK